MARNVVTVSHLYPSPAFPGLGPFVRDQVVALSRTNRVAVVSPLLSSITKRRLARVVRSVPMYSIEDGIEIVRPRPPTLHFAGLHARSRLWSFLLEPNLRRMCSRIDGELVHAHFALPDGFAAARYASRAGVPLVVTVWGSDVMVFGRKRSLRPLLRTTFAEAGAVIAVSAELAERSVALGAPADRVHVVPGGVPYRATAPRDEARTRLGVESSVCVLWIGGLVAVKQPLHAVAAVERLAQEDDREIVLVMIGDGPLRRDVERHIRTRNLDGRVRLLGYCSRDAVWMWQCAADVLINSSRTEGTPLAVLEALGAGTPVAAYPVGGIEPVLDAVAGGTVAATATPTALASAIEEALAADQAREALAKRARARFDIALTVRALEGLYDALV